MDNQRIEQVVSNLVSNAIKFTDNDGRIIVKTENITFDDIDKTKLLPSENAIYYSHYVKVSVADSGIGIAESDLKKVFDQFQQIENSLNRKNGGTGLGLPIAKQLIEAHRGFIWVESELNRGTTFSFVIPVLSEKEKFVIDLEKDIAKAKVASQTLLLLMLAEKLDVQNSFINAVKEERISIIRKTSNTKEVSYTDDGKNYLLIVMPEADKFAQSFVEKRIDSSVSIENDSHAEQKYDILYSTALFPECGEDATYLLNKLKQDLRKSNLVEA